MDEIATVIQSALRSVIDARSSVISGVEQNNNYNSTAFSGVEVTWIGTESRFKIENAYTDPCYVYYIDTATDLIQDLGLRGYVDYIPLYASQEWLNYNQNLLSDDIDEVLGLLNTRAQVTIKHVYVTPIIHTFNLTGTIYVNQLYDKDDVMREVNNEIYDKLNDGADFNSPIWKSYLIELIEKFPSIKHADVKIEPDVPLPSTTISSRTTNFYPVHGQYDTVDGDSNYEEIYEEIFKALNNYLGETIFSLSLYSAEQEWRNWITTKRALTADQIYADSNINGITERNFIGITSQGQSGFVKTLYDAIEDVLGISTTNSSTFSGTNYQDTSRFLDLISDIHKDLSYIIRSNMLDVSNNIAPQYTYVDNSLGTKTKTYVRGGYTIGSEIVKMDVTASYEYKT